MAETLYNSSMQGCGVGEPDKSYKLSSNNINICSISEAGIPVLRIRDDSKHDHRPIHYESMKNID
jgi:hypothetical protein